MLRLIIAIGIALLTPFVSAALEPVVLRCDYEGGTFTSYDEGKISHEKSGGIEGLIFDIIKPDEGIGKMIGNAGSSPVEINYGTNSIHIIERTETGNFNLATVYIGNKQAKKFFSVYARHINGFGPMATHLYGFCRKWD